MDAKLSIMKKRIIYLSGVLVTIFTVVTLINFFAMSKESLTTAEYIKQFDVSKYEKDGSDYFNKKYDIKSRLHKPLSEVDRVYDYDFDEIDRVEKKLQNVDRRTALKYIFEQATKNAKTNMEKHLKLLYFLQRISFDNKIQAMYKDKQMVVDPLVLLELHEMRCGQVARLAVDLFNAAGYKTRLVQASGHVMAEIYYDGNWHYLDADRSGSGQVVIMNGKIPSVAEMAKDPQRVDLVYSSIEDSVAEIGDYFGAVRDMAYILFSNKDSFNTDPGSAAYYYKTATPEQEKNSKICGWNYYKTEYNRWPLSNLKLKVAPYKISFRNVTLMNDVLKLSWKVKYSKQIKVLQQDSIKYYKVFVSDYSRGWNYHDCDNVPEICKYFSPYRYTPEMYNKLLNTPPSDLGFYEVENNKFSLNLRNIKQIRGDYVYITIEPVSEYLEKVGRKHYLQSYELRFPISKEGK